MEIISDIANNKGIIDKILSKHACSAEHNYYCYVYNVEPWQLPYVFLFDGQYMILAKYDKKGDEWYFVVEPVAPQDRKVACLIEALEYVFSKKIKKVWLELETKTRAQLLSSLKEHPYLKANKINYTLTWPVFQLDQWNGDKMEGKDWKDLRYYWNKFFKEHKVEFVKADKVAKDDMKKLVYDWKMNRTTGDRAYIEYFLHAIENGFAGYDINRIMLVDGKVGAITAGFMSREGYYYSSIGLYDKSIDRSNEIANMDDLINLKKLDYKIVDFGGVEKKSLEFKKKFRPTYYYKTHIFSIVRTDNS
jgi:hypothetical protein